VYGAAIDTTQASVYLHLRLVVTARVGWMNPVGGFFH
jgi:hypothetical protein